MTAPKVSIIIPVSNWNKYLEECIRHCLELDYPDYEIIVLPDNSLTLTLPDFNRGGKGEGDKFKVFPTGHIGPAAKRNIGLQHATGEVIAFIDDDTYPRKDWLKNAIKNFGDSEIAAVGGPSVTPMEDRPRQKASGAVYESLMGGGAYRYRYKPLKKRYVDDYPSCNFITRKGVLDELGGFQTNFWPGEDTALCLDIVHKLSKKIIYDPDVLIYHHRRPLFKSHLRQVRAYALHRGYFAKRFPKTSLRFSYFLPSIFTVFLVFGGVINLKLYLIGLLVYILLSINKGILTFLGIVSTHITYGIWFLVGLFSRRLREEQLWI